jgi:L-lysine 2,3-aminomutase
MASNDLRTSAASERAILAAHSALDPRKAIVPTWQQSLQHAFRSVDALLECLELTPAQLPPLDRTNPFPLLVPHEFVRRMRPGDPHDPLLRQILPLESERSLPPGFVADPVNDAQFESSPGLLHKYATRVLLIAAGTCAVNCRYCFRRHYPYQDSPKSNEAWEPALATIASDTSIEEVLLSGGDPLALGNAKLTSLVRGIEAIAHVRRLRIHTRFPVMIPQRVDDGLCELFEKSRLTTWVVLHINHANEVDQAVADAASKLRRCGVCVLNQSVLLRGINDRLEDQRELCSRLVDAGIQPYYLHQLDPVAGASHFECEQSLGESIVRELRSMLSGYAVPRFVKEIPGRTNKTLLG